MKKRKKIHEKKRKNWKKKLKTANKINNDNINKKRKKSKFPVLVKRKNSFIPYKNRKSFSIQSREKFLNPYLIFYEN